MNLFEKLQTDKYTNRLVLEMPDDLSELEGLSFDTSPSKAPYDMILAFVFTIAQMSELIDKTVAGSLVNTGGYLFFAYPKKGNKRYCMYIERDAIMPSLGVDESNGFVQGTLLKFSKMFAFNDIFTVVGLKNEKKAAVSVAASQCVDDYIDKIPDLLAYLEHIPEILALYEKLSPGYRKDWARYVYSAKSEATVEKRLLEMQEILSAGYKSKDLFRQGKK